MLWLVIRTTKALYSCSAVSLLLKYNCVKLCQFILFLVCFVFFIFLLFTVLEKKFPTNDNSIVSTLWVTVHPRDQLALGNPLGINTTTSPLTLRSYWLPPVYHELHWERSRCPEVQNDCWRSGWCSYDCALLLWGNVKWRKTADE